MVLTGGVSLHSARRRLCGEILPLIFEPDIVLSLYRSTVSVLTLLMRSLSRAMGALLLLLALSIFAPAASHAPQGKTHVLAILADGEPAY